MTDQPIVDTTAPISQWRLRIWREPGGYRAEVQDPDGASPWARSLSDALDDSDDSVFPAVRGFFAVRGLDHVGVSLIEQARAELRP